MKATNSLLQLPFGWVMILMIAGLCVHDAQSFTVYQSESAQRIELLEIDAQNELQDADILITPVVPVAITFFEDDSTRNFYQQMVRIQLNQADSQFAKHPVSFLQLRLMFKATRLSDDRLKS